jgi:hypothetical protein
MQCDKQEAMDEASDAQDASTVSAMKAALAAAARTYIPRGGSESKMAQIAQCRGEIAALLAKRPKPSWRTIAELMRPVLDVHPDTWRRGYNAGKRQRKPQGRSNETATAAAPVPPPASTQVTLHEGTPAPRLSEHAGLRRRNQRP